MRKYECECGWSGRNINSVLTHVDYEHRIKVYRPGVDIWFQLEDVPDRLRKFIKSVPYEWKYSEGIYYATTSYVCDQHLVELNGRQGILRHLENEHDLIILFYKRKFSINP